jgi:hypothetical protein
MFCSSSRFVHRFVIEIWLPSDGAGQRSIERDRRVPSARRRGNGSPAVRSTGTLAAMSDVVEEAAPRAHARIVYLGPVSPHWEVYGDWGERQVLDEFRARALARLVLLPRDDPQFRRNKERINRDAERELISIEWELGLPGDAPE